MGNERHDRPLAGRVAVVTGASRGAGRGIALELGAADATVYVTGRSTREQPATQYDRLQALSGISRIPGTIDDTADEVTRLGGLGIAARCDHTDEDHWQQRPELAGTESPRYVGRAVAALAADPRIMDRTGRVLRVGDLAADYGFTDIDGRRIPPFEMQND